MGTPRKSKKADDAQPSTVQPTVTFEQVKEATIAGSFVFTSAEFHAPLIAQNLVEINPAMTDEHGNIATRAVLIDAQDPTPEPQKEKEMTEAQVKTKPTFEIEEGLAIPARTRKGGNTAGRTPIYPFESLGINQSFFVADKGDKSAAKSLGSTVAAANARYQEVIEGQTRVNRKGATVPATKQLRKFQVFETTKEIDGVEVKGARVFRVAVPA